MMNIYATMDVAAITEEVVEGVYAGQIYQDISSTDATDFSAAAAAEAVNRGVARRQVSKTKEVEVLIDISHGNYVFTTQPGALKRVIVLAPAAAQALTLLGNHEYFWQCIEVYNKRLYQS